MQSIYTVAQVNSYIKNMFMQDYMLQSILIRGEVSNCKYHSSGHIYFTLKDGKGAIACVMFAGYRSGLQFQLTQGQQIVVEGSVEVYERDGKYQMYARQIRLDGAGLLYEKFEQLKRDLEDRGMFDACYKQPIPKYIRTLGVVTAPTGAAVRDIIQVASRRNPYVQVILYPAIVQGEQAAPSIINGIRALEQLKVDTIIVGRGGGSIEDLWAFNEEAVAQAVFDCTVPIISAVGHETDTTIVDFVSDLRAPTPSAAAELAVYNYVQLEERLFSYEAQLEKALHHQAVKYKNRLLQYQLRLKYVSPMNQIREKRLYALKTEEKLQELMERIVRDKRHALDLYIEKMRGLSPLDKLNQGFSYVSDEQGKTVNSIDKTEAGKLLYIQVKDGEIQAKVCKKEKNDVVGRNIC